jgi:hypothetical protein
MLPNTIGFFKLEICRMKNSEQQKTEKSESIAEITSHAHAEIAWVRGAYKFAAGIIGIIVVVGIYFSYESARDFKNDIKQDGKEDQDRMNKDVTLLEQKLTQDMQSQANIVRQEVAKRINDEFASSNIVALVTEKAKERIDLIADVLIAQNITNKLGPIRAELVSELNNAKEKEDLKFAEMDNNISNSLQTESNLQAVLVDAKNTLKTLNDQSDFIITVIKAQNDNRSAFEKLNKWAGDTTYQMHDEAKAIIQEIKVSYYDPNNVKSFSLFPWSQMPIKPEALNIEQIEQIWNSIPPYIAKGFIDGIWGNTNITQVQKFTFFYSVIEKDSRNSLLAANRAAYLLAGELKANYNPSFQYSDIESKWTEWIKTNSVVEAPTNTSLQSKP